MLKINLFTFLLTIYSSTGCMSLPGWKHKGDPVAQSVLGKLYLCEPILFNAFTEIKKCLGDEGDKINELKGEIKIEKGYLFISKVEPKNPQVFITQHGRECLDNVVGKPRRDVANGVVYNPSLLSRDFIYVFHGHLYPEVGGEVKSVDYQEIRKF